MDEASIKQILALIKREVTPTIGCTEPIAVALCVSRAVETLGVVPSILKVVLSPNIYKNAMGVGIPNTGMTGLPIAIALGATIGRSEYGLEVLKHTTSDAVKNAKQFLEEIKLSIDVDTAPEDILYIRCEASNAQATATTVISGSHTHFTRIEKDGNPILQSESSSIEETEDDCNLDFRRVYDFATQAPVEELEFLWESAEMNLQAAELSFKGNYGHGLGAMLRNDSHHSIFGDTLFNKILSYTSGACDARMSGAMVPVMSNSGSGNQGISVTVPIAVFAKENHISREKTLRALALSHLVVIYIKQSLGRLSALCGCVVAATGSSCGITMLMGGGYEEITYAVKNMVANLTGMICDGAKPSCSLKVTSGVATAVLSAVLAVNHRYTTSLEGIIDDDVNKCIHNLTAIGKNGMHETDNMILQIMNDKCVN